MKLYFIVSLFKYSGMTSATEQRIFVNKCWKLLLEYSFSAWRSYYFSDVLIFKMTLKLPFLDMDCCHWSFFIWLDLPISFIIFLTRYSTSYSELEMLPSKLNLDIIFPNCWGALKWPTQSCILIVFVFFLWDIVKSVTLKIKSLYSLGLDRSPNRC